MQPGELPMKQRAWSPTATLPVLVPHKWITFGLWRHLALPKCCGLPLLAADARFFWGGSQHTTPHFKPLPLLWLSLALLFLSTSAASPLYELQRGEGRAWPCCCIAMATGALWLNHAPLPSSRHKARGAPSSSEGRDPPHQRGEAERREPHRLRAAGEANRELQ